MPVFAVGATHNGRVLMLGLTQQDLLGLVNGVTVKGELERATGIKGLQLLVFFGDDEESIKAEISAIMPTRELQKHETAEDLNKMLDEDVKKVMGGQS